MPELSRRSGSRLAPKEISQRSRAFVSRPLACSISVMGITVNEAGRRRWRGVGKEARAKLAGKAAGSYWAKLTPEERSVEMKRRAKVRTHNRARKSRS
jgi:hypothetical protein